MITPFDDFVYLVNNVLLGEEPVSIVILCQKYNLLLLTYRPLKILYSWWELLWHS